MNCHNIGHSLNEGDGKKNLEQFPLGGKGFSRADSAQIHPVSGFQLFRSVMMTLWERAFMP